MANSRSQPHQKSPNPAWMAVLPRCALCQRAREARRCCREWQGRAAPGRRVLPGMARRLKTSPPVGGQGSSRCERPSSAQRGRTQCSEQWRNRGARGQNGHRSLAAAVTDFLDETKLTKKPRPTAAYSTALNYFLESCPKLNLEDVDRKDLLKFSAFLRDEKEQSPRSVYNKFENVMTFLKAQGIRAWWARTTGRDS